MASILCEVVLHTLAHSDGLARKSLFHQLREELKEVGSQCSDAEDVCTLLQVDHALAYPTPTPYS